MANEIVVWGRGPLRRAVSLDKLADSFEEFGNDGLSLREIGDRMGTDAGRITRKYPELKSAYQRGIDGRTIDVEAMLMKRALGYKGTNKTVTRRLVGGKEVEVLEKVEDVDILPDVGAMRLLLKGRTKRYSGDEDMKVGVIVNLNAQDSRL